MNIIGRLIVRTRQKLFMTRVEREIYFGIFSHLHGEADHGYPFMSEDELYKVRLAGSLALKKMLCDVDQASMKMPRMQGEAFRFIFARDMEQQMRKYLQYAQQREYPEWAPTPVVTTA